MNARYKFNSCPPGLCPRGAHWDQLAAVDNGGETSSLTRLFTNALVGVAIGAPAGAVVAGGGKRVNGALLGGAVGAGASVLLAMLL